MKSNPREYGLGDSTGNVRGVPRVTARLDAGKDDIEGQAPVCPNCGCRTLYQIEVDVEHALLRGNTGKGMYLGCPACPWASPMVMIGGR